MPDSPMIPPGMTVSDFGTRIMRWGHGDKEARDRMATLTLEELQNGGVTLAIAVSWRNLYVSEVRRLRGHPSAAARPDLVHRAVPLVGRQQPVVTETSASGSTVALRLANSREHPIQFYLEPWGEAYEMAPSAVFDLTARGES